MFREILKDIAPLLGVLLPAIAAYFAYRATERKREKDLAEAAKPNLQVVGGVLASREGAILYVEEMQRMTQAIDRLAEAFNRQADAAEHAQNRWSALLDEMERARRALEEMSNLMERIRPDRSRR